MKTRRILSVAVIGLLLGSSSIALHYKQQARNLDQRLQETETQRASLASDLERLAREADARGRTGLEDEPYRQADYLRAALDACVTVNIQSLVDEGLSGSKLGQQLRAQRIAALTVFKDNNASDYI